MLHKYCGIKACGSEIAVAVSEWWLNLDFIQRFLTKMRNAVKFLLFSANVHSQTFHEISFQEIKVIHNFRNYF